MFSQSFPGAQTMSFLGLEVGAGVDEPLCRLRVALKGRPLEWRPTWERVNPVTAWGAELWLRRDRRGGKVSRHRDSLVDFGSSKNKNPKSIARGYK